MWPGRRLRTPLVCSLGSCLGGAPGSSRRQERFPPCVRPGSPQARPTCSRDASVGRSDMFVQWHVRQIGFRWWSRHETLFVQRVLRRHQPCRPALVRFMSTFLRMPGDAAI